MRNKILSYILSGVLVLSSACSVYSQDIESTIIYKDDFESYTQGETGDGKGGFDTFSGTIEESGENKYAAFGHMETATKFYDVSTGKITASFDVMETQIADARIFTLQDGNSKRSIRLLISGGAIKFTYSDGTDKKEINLSSVEAGKWYNISIDADYTEQVINQVYLNGTEKLTEPLSFFEMESVSTNNLYILREGAENNTGKLCIDNVIIMKNLYPELNKKISETKGLLSSKCGTATGEFPASAFTVLSEAVESAEVKAFRTDLTESEISELINKLNEVQKVFKESIIQGKVDNIYEENFESHTLDATFNANIAGSSTVKADDTNKYIVLGNRFTQSVGNLPEKYYIYMKIKTASNTGRLRLFDVHEGFFGMEVNNGQLLAWKNNGGGADEFVAMESFAIDTWHTIKILIDRDANKATVYHSENDTDFTELGEYDAINASATSSRLFDTRWISGSGEVHLDNICVTPHIEQTVTNDVNHVRITAPRYVLFGESATLLADVYDKLNTLWDDQSVQWIVKEGDVCVTADGVVSANSSFCGTAKIKAKVSENIFEYANIIFLPEAEITDVKADIKDNKLIVSAKYDILNYVDTDVEISVFGDGINENVTALKLEKDAIKAEFVLPANLKTQSLAIKIKNTQFSAEKDDAVKFYGSDSKDVLLKAINDNISDSAKIVSLIDEFKNFGAPKVNFVWEKNSAEFADKITDAGTFADFTALSERICEINVILGVKYAQREHIETLISDNKAFLSENGLSKEFTSLSNGQKEKVYLSIIGFVADDLKGITKKINKEINSVLEEEKKDTYIPNNKYNGNSGSSGGVGGSFKVEPIPPAENDKSDDSQNKNDSFKDIDLVPWAKDAILKLNEKNVLVGYGGYVNPEREVTRAEFAKMIETAFSIAGENTNVYFTDFDEDAWWAKSVKNVAAAGIINGFEDNSFKAEKFITREEAAVILARTIAFSEISVYDKTSESNFADDSDISDYAKDAVKQLKLCKVMSGRDNNHFVPRATVTRAEAAVMIVNILDFEDNK